MWRYVGVPAVVALVGCGGSEPTRARAAHPDGGSSGASGGGTAGSTARGGSSGSQQGGAGGGMPGGSGGTSSGGTSSGGTSSGGEPGPTCTVVLDQSASLSDIGSALSSAAPGGAVCLERGTTFRGSLQIRNSNATADNRVTLCAAPAGGRECSPDGGSNPRIEGDGAGISFGGGTQGIVLKNIDVVCSSGCADDAPGVDFRGASNVRIEGGVFSGWGWAFLCNSFGSTTPCDGIEVGVRGNLTEITGNRGGFYGWLSNSFVRVNAHDNGDGAALTHHWYLSSGPNDAPSRNVVFEDGYYTRSSVSNGISRGTFIKLSGQNQDLIFRNNVFEDEACDVYLIGCGTGSEDPEEFCDGMEIYNNYFKSDCPLALYLESTQRARIYNNVFFARSNGRMDGMAAVEVLNGERPAADAWFFNNTIYCPANCGTNPYFGFAGSDNRFFNNLIHFETTGQPLIGGNSACSRFGGADGPNMRNNFLYAPRSSPRLPNCGSGNSTVFDVEPGMVAPSEEDFRLMPGAPAAAFGIADGAPELDRQGNVRPTPPSAGAYDLN